MRIHGTFCLCGQRRNYAGFPYRLCGHETVYTDLYGNPSSLYSVGREAKKHLELARADVAACLNAEPNEIFFTSGGSEADNWAIKGIAHQLAKKGKKHIITSKFEHHAVLHTCASLEKEAFPSPIWTSTLMDSYGRRNWKRRSARTRPW